MRLKILLEKKKRKWKWNHITIGVTKQPTRKKHDRDSSLFCFTWIPRIHLMSPLVFNLNKYLCVYFSSFFHFFGKLLTDLQYTWMFSFSICSKLSHRIKALPLFFHSLFRYESSGIHLVAWHKQNNTFLRAKQSSYTSN